MSRTHLGRTLNVLLEAERAGARLLAAYLDELPPRSSAWLRLRAVQRDEARNCAVLIHHLLEAGLQPSAAVGEFYRKGLAICDWHDRVDFLNRGQAWVAKYIAAALPSLPASEVRRALEAMHESHLANIELCEHLVD